MFWRSRSASMWLDFLPFRALPVLDKKKQTNTALVLYVFFLFWWCSLLPSSWLSWRQHLEKRIPSKKDLGWWARLPLLRSELSSIFHWWVHAWLEVLCINCIRTKVSVWAQTESRQNRYFNWLYSGTELYVTKAKV